MVCEFFVSAIDCAIIDQLHHSDVSQVFSTYSHELVDTPTKIDLVQADTLTDIFTNNTLARHIFCYEDPHPDQAFIDSALRAVVLEGALLNRLDGLLLLTP